MSKLATEAAAINSSELQRNWTSCASTISAMTAAIRYRDDITNWRCKWQSEQEHRPITRFTSQRGEKRGRSVLFFFSPRWFKERKRGERAENCVTSLLRDCERRSRRRARPTSHKCFTRYFIFRAPTLRTERRGLGFRSCEKNHSAHHRGGRTPQWNYLHDSRYFSATRKNFTNPALHETCVSLKVSLSLFPPFSLHPPSLFFFFLSFLHLTLYRQRGMLVLVGLTRRDFRTTKLRTSANVCKFAERISGSYC